MSSKIPAELARSLEKRDALVRSQWCWGKRRFMRADSDHGPLFAKYSLDPRDEVVFDHESVVRELIGTAGVLRSPPILERGPLWLLEAAIDSDPWMGAAAMDTIVEAAERILALPLPRGPHTEGWLRRSRRRARTLGVPLLLVDILRAKRMLRHISLPRLPSHGYLHPNHAFLSGGSSWVVDWEDSGPRPAGFDLMRFWANLDRPEDQHHLLEKTVELVGPRHREELLRLRYVLAVRAIASKLGSSRRADLDLPSARRLLSLLPLLRREAGAG